ncbi:transcription factor 23 [Oncorhynchus kisutch]|nr:transcription factor 23 [Oncorhynchus kisutch]
MKSQHSPENAARERSRVRNLRQAFHSLQAALPSVPRDTKLSKLDVLVLATDYIAHLTETLDQGGALSELTVPPRAGGYLHPVKKWPMRSLLYCGSTAVSQSEASVRGGGNTSTDPYPRGRHGPIRLGLGALKYNISNCDAYETPANGKVMYVLNTETPRTMSRLKSNTPKSKDRFD